MTDDVSKLPAWPDPETHDSMDWRSRVEYAEHMERASLARMEALVEVVRKHYWALVWDATDVSCAQASKRFDALLAACERKES